MTQMLLGLKACLETAEFEERIAAIEAAVTARANQTSAPSAFKPKLMS
jgi:hypothetical protein